MSTAHSTGFLAAFAAAITMMITPLAHATDILVAVDSSGSMASLTTDGQMKLTAAKEALYKVGPMLQEHESSVMLFGHRARSSGAEACTDIETVIPFGQMSPARFGGAIDSLRARGRTPLAKTMELALANLLKLDRDTQKIMILLTDGNETCGGDPIAAAAALIAAGIQVEVHVIGFALKPGEDAQLRAIAHAGGGRYVSADDAATLGVVLPKIVRSAVRSTAAEEVSRNWILSDDFEGETLSDAWEVLRPDEERFAVVDGKAYLVSQWNKNGMPERHNVVRTRNAINANDFECQADMSYQLTSQTQHAGIMLHQDDENYIEFSYYAYPHGYNIRRAYSITKVVAGKAANIEKTIASGSDREAQQMKLKLVRRGFTVSCLVGRIGAEGELVWLEAGQVSAAGLSNLHLALTACNDAEKHYGSGTVPETDAQYDNVTIIASEIKRTVSDVAVDGAHYITTFDAHSVAADFEFENADDTHKGVANDLNITTQYGDYGNDKAPLRNLAMLKKALPSGNYTIELQARGRITSQHVEFGLVLIQDNNKMLRLGHYGKEWGYNVTRRHYLAKKIGDKISHVEEGRHRMGAATEDETLVFKLEKKGPKFTGSVYTKNVETGEMEWLEIGSQTMLGFKPRLGLVARNLGPKTYGSGPTHEVNITFEKLVIR